MRALGSEAILRRNVINLAIEFRILLSVPRYKLSCKASRLIIIGMKEEIKRKIKERHP